MHIPKEQRLRRARIELVPLRPIDVVSLRIFHFEFSALDQGPRGIYHLEGDRIRAAEIFLNIMLANEKGCNEATLKTDEAGHLKGGCQITLIPGRAGRFPVRYVLEACMVFGINEVQMQSLAKRKSLQISMSFRVVPIGIVRRLSGVFQSLNKRYPGRLLG